MNKKIIAVLLGILISIATVAQQPVKDKLLQLKKPNRPVPKYVNFDVIKIMLGHGWGAGAGVPSGTGLSFDLQLLSPYAKLKDIFPVAIGITAGYSKMTITGRRYEFTGKRLTGISTDAAIDNTVQRTGYLGLVALPVIRYRSITILTGASVNYNFFNKIKMRTDDGNTSYHSNQLVNRISVPLYFELSVSRKQFISFGPYASYDLVPRFKVKDFKKIRQAVVGLSVGVII